MEKNYIEVEQEVPADNLEHLDITDQLSDSARNVLREYCLQRNGICVGCHHNKRFGCDVGVPKNWPEQQIRIKENKVICGKCHSYAEIPTEHGIVRRCTKYKILLGERNVEIEAPSWCKKEEAIGNGKAD